MTDAQLERIIETHRWAVSDNRTTMRRLDGWQDAFRRHASEMAYDTSAAAPTWMPRVVIAAIGIPMSAKGWEWLLKIEAVVVRAEELGLRKAREDWKWYNGSEVHLDGRRCRTEDLVLVYNVLVHGRQSSFANTYRKVVANGI
jgi:hypothetical protein